MKKNKKHKSVKSTADKRENSVSELKIAVANTVELEDFPIENIPLVDATVESPESEIMTETYIISKTSHKKPILLGAMGAIIFAGLITGYLVYFSGRVLPGVRVANIALGGVQKSQVSQVLENKLPKPQISIVKPDGSKSEVSLDDLGVSVDSTVTIAAVKDAKQGSIIQKMQFWKNVSIPKPVAVVDRTKFDQVIESYEKAGDIEPVDASLAISSEAEVVLTPETIGNKIGFANAYEEVMAGVEKGTTVTLIAKSTERKPRIYMSDLKSAADEAEKILSTPINLTAKSDNWNPSRVRRASWLIISMNVETGKAEVGIDNGAISEYIQLSTNEYISPQRSQIVLGSGAEQRILVAGQSGSTVANRSEIVTEIVSSLPKGRQINATFIITPIAFEVVQATNADKWIEVDVTNKVMTAWRGNVAENTFLVSAGAPNTPTVLGTYNIYSKLVKQDMRGANADGTNYFQPDVEYVNYFYQSYAIHGNYWRPLSWFGNINSSHGCVGLPNTGAAWIYDWAPIGTPVNIHE
jgi:lipoprotein-anchoring transpeptidase ErfK/SrfK